jgi:hypothetical protein
VIRFTAYNIFSIRCHNTDRCAEERFVIMKDRATNPPEESVTVTYAKFTVPATAHALKAVSRTLNITV